MNIFGKTLVAVDIHDHLVQFVELRAHGKKVVLESYNRLPIQSGLVEDGEIKSSVELKQVLSTLFSAANPKPAKLGDLAVILSTKLTFIHIFKLPANLSIKDLSQLIPIEAENIIPFSINDVYWDFTVLEKQKKDVKDPYQLVLFAAVQKTVADSYSELFSSLGVTPVLFGVQPETLLHALSSQLNPEKNSFVIELGPISTNYLFLKGKTILKFFSSNGGIEDFICDLAEKYQLPVDELTHNWEHSRTDVKFAEDIQNFIAAQYKQAHTILTENVGLTEKFSVSDIYLTGEFSNLPNFFEQAKNSFPDYQVLVGDPKVNLLIDDKKFASNLEKKGGSIPYSIYFTNPIGLALNGLRVSSKEWVNLLPDEIKSHFIYKKFALIMSAAAVIMLIASFSITGFILILHQELNFQRMKLAIEKSAVEQTLYGTRYQEVQTALTEFNDEVSALTRIDKSLISVPETLKAVMALIPSGITITTLDFADSDLSVSLEGIAPERSDLLDLQSNLKGSELIKEVDLPLSSYDESNNISFSTKILLNFTQLPAYASSTSL